MAAADRLPVAAPAVEPVAAITSLAEACASIVNTISPGGEGLCMGTAAVFARALADQGVPCEAVHGFYDGQAHWWLETATLRIDITRRQFELAPEVETKDTPGPYVEGGRYPDSWTHEQAVAEFARMYETPGYGAWLGEQLQNDLAELVQFSGDWTAGS